MRVDITGRHVEVDAPLRHLIDRRLAKLDRLLNDSAISAQVVLTLEKYRHRTEIIIHARGDHMICGLGEGRGWAISVKNAAAKIEQQAHTLKGKWGARKRLSAGSRVARPSGPPEPSTPGGRVVRATRYPVKPMSVEDALLRVDSGKDSFIVFRNAETDAVSILYRRTDGNYGLIEPD